MSETPAVRQNSAPVPPDKSSTSASKRGLVSQNPISLTRQTSGVMKSLTTGLALACRPAVGIGKESHLTMSCTCSTSTTVDIHWRQSPLVRPGLGQPSKSLKLQGTNLVSESPWSIPRERLDSTQRDTGHWIGQAWTPLPKSLTQDVPSRQIQAQRPTP